MHIEDDIHHCAPMIERRTHYPHRLWHSGFENQFNNYKCSPRDGKHH